MFELLKFKLILQILRNTSNALGRSEQSQFLRNPGKIRILEIYEDEAAYQAHLQTPHFLTYKISTLSMVEKLDLVDMNPLDEAAMPLIFKKLAERK